MNDYSFFSAPQLKRDPLGSSLSPHVNAPTAKVALVTDEGDVETLWAFELGGALYRLDNLPFLNYRVSLGDVIEATPDGDGMLVMRRVVEKSGNRTVRLVLDERDLSHEMTYESTRLVDQLKELGCGFERATKGILAVNVPANVSLPAVADLLSQSAFEWEYSDPTYEDLFP